MPTAINTNAKTKNMNNEGNDWIFIPEKCLVNTAAMFGRTIADSKK